MLAFLRCVAEAVAETGVKGLVEMVPGGAYACAVAGAAWKKYRERKKVAEQRAEIQELAEASFEKAREAAVEAVKAALPPTATPEDRLNLELYLSQVPGTVRASLKRPDDATGKTVPPAFSLNSADDVVRLLPGRPPRFKPNDPVPGLAGWYLAEPLGAGGFGEVWLAKHRTMASLCGAVKFCHGQQARDLKHESGLIDRVMSAGKHPNIVPLTNAYLEGDTPWLMYEYVPGGDLTGIVLQLRNMAAEQRMAQVLGILKQLSAAVAHFHRLTPAIVHRDLKPNNILVHQAGRRLLVTDFGIGSITARTAIREDTRGGTVTGRLLSHLRGSYTPLYSSPQQREGSDPDPRDDIHALGVIAFQLLTGQLTQGPGSDFAHDLRAVGTTEPLVDLVGRCVSRNQTLRPANGQELFQRLEHLPADISAPTRSAPGPMVPVAPVPLPNPYIPHQAPIPLPARVGFVVDEPRLAWYLARLGAIHRANFDYNRDDYAPLAEPELTPLPENLSSSQTVVLILGGAVGLGVFLSLVGIASRFLLITGLIITVVFSIALWVVVMNSPYRRELKRRREAERSAANHLHTTERRWSEICERHDACDQSCRDAITSSVEGIRGLARSYSEELAGLARHAERAALQQHMRNHVIAVADIPNIGDKLKLHLAANNILTAYDIDQREIQRIGGFGPDRTRSLLAWQAEVLSRFLFDPYTHIPPTESESVAARYYQQQTATFAEIERTLTELEGLAGWARKEIDGLIPELRDAVAEWMRAKANLRLIEAGQ